MKINESSKHNVGIVTLSGTLDAISCPEFRTCKAICDPTQTVVIDLEHLNFIDSSGLGAIVSAARKKRQQQRDLLLACMNNRVRKVFEITNTQKLFHIFDDAEAALDYATRQEEQGT